LHCHSAPRRTRPWRGHRFAPHCSHQERLHPPQADTVPHQNSLARTIPCESTASRNDRLLHPQVSINSVAHIAQIVCLLVVHLGCWINGAAIPSWWNTTVHGATLEAPKCTRQSPGTSIRSCSFPEACRPLCSPRRKCKQLPLGKQRVACRCWCGSAPASLRKDWHTFHINPGEDPDAAQVTMYAFARQLDLSVE